MPAALVYWSVGALMAAERKLSDEDVDRLRTLAEDGWSQPDLAVAFGISREHVGRLVRGEQRPAIGAVDVDAVSGDGVRVAVDAFLDDVVLDLGGEALAATARAVAAKLD